MNKLFTKIAKLTLGLAMAAGVGVAVAGNNKEATPVHATEELAYTLTPSGTGNNSYASSGTTSGTAPLWTVEGNGTTTPWRLGGKSSNCSAADRRVFSTSAVSSQNISKVVLTVGNASSITVNSLSLKVGTSAGGSETSTVAGTFVASSDITFNRPSSADWTSKFFTFTFNLTVSGTSNKFVEFTTAKFYYEKATSYTVTKNGTNCSISGASTVDGSQAEDFTITPSANYDAPETITVKAGSTTLTQNTHYSYYTSDYVGHMTLNKNGQTGNITITAVAVAQLTVTDSVTHGSLSSTARIHSGDDLDVTIVPDSGYTYPTSVSVTMGEDDVTGDIVYENGEILYGPVTGNVVVTATCPAAGNTYSISTTVTNGTYSGDTTITDNGGVASVTISPTGDYKLPTSVSVSGASHTYNAETGVISLSSATGDVTISAAMVALTEYSITVNQTNGSHTGASTIKESRTASLTFTPASGYGQPSSVTVSGATSSWTRGTGVLSLSNPTGDVTVTYTAVGNELDSITISANSGSYTLGDNFVMPTVTAKYTVNEDADVTSSASYSGYDPYTTGSQPVTISYTEGGITKTQSYTATVSAKQVTTNTTWTRVTSIDDLTAGTYIIGYEATAGSGIIVPLRSDGANATTSANGYFYTGTTADSSNSNTISIATNMTSTGYEFTVEKISSDVINIKNAAGNYLGATSGGTTSNKGRLYTSGNSNETNFTVNYSSGKFSMTAAVSGSYKYLKYNSGSPRYAVYNSSANDTSFYKKGTQSTGSASLIRIVAEYTGGDKYVGDTIYTTDFTVQKQLDTGTTLTTVTDFTINGESSYVLASTSNNITVSYTEGGVTKTATVVVSATEREASLEHVVLNVGENAKLDGYVYWSGAEWDLTDITVTYDWDDDDFDETVNLQDLVDSGDATLSPATPTLGATSFTVSYSYLEKNIENATVTLDEAVVADYVSSVSWSGKSLANFKAFSGQELTSSTVDSWTVKATYAGAGESSALSFGTGANQFSIKVGSKSVTSLPYTWQTEDDGAYVAVVVGGVVKEDHTYAKADICASINAIDHEVEGEASITIDLTDASKYTKTGTSGTGSETEVTLQGFTFWSDKGYAANGESMRVYSGAEFKITSDYTITSVSYTFTGGKNGLAGGSDLSTNEYSETASSQARVVSVTIGYEGTVVSHFANQVDHFDAQKKVVEFAKFMNNTMNGTNVCSGTFANLESAWNDVADKYDELFGASTTLNETELAWAKNMLKYADAQWGSDEEAACVEKAMKTYEFCVANHSDVCTAFLSGVRTVGSAKVSPLSLFNSGNTNTVAIIVIISMVSMTTIGGYFFLRKRKENI